MTDLSEHLERWDAERDGPPVVGDEPVAALDAVRR